MIPHQRVSNYKSQDAAHGHYISLDYTVLFYFQPESIEVDVIVDAALFLWHKCKVVFQRYQTGSVDNPRYLSKMENPTKVCRYFKNHLQNTKMLQHTALKTSRQKY